MEGLFKINGKVCNVSLQNDVLVLEYDTEAKHKKTQTRRYFILTGEILSVELLDGGIRIHHVVSRVDKRLRTDTTELHGDAEQCRKLKEMIDNIIQALNRPKRLLVFINPKSGHKKGVKIFRSKVAPLFRLCGIHTELIVTERPGEPVQALATCDLRLLHGIVSVGGDGMYSECVNGLLLRLQRDAGIDVDDVDVPITASKIPIGIIPTGSGNYLANYIHGTRDIETATLKIILGDHIMSNVASIHQGRQLTCYASLVLEFGLIGAMMHDCETFKWLGPRRYDVIPVTTLMRRKPLDVEIQYLPEDTPTNSSKSHKRQLLRQTSLPAKQEQKTFRQRIKSSPNMDKRKREGWRRLEGRVYGVDTYVVTLAERADRLVPSFGDSALSVWVTDKCSMMEHVQQLTKFQKEQSGCWDYDFIRQVRACAYRVKLSSAATTTDEFGEKHLKQTYYINADGEAVRLHTPEFEVRLHPCTIAIFGKGGS